MHESFGRTLARRSAGLVARLAVCCAVIAGFFGSSHAATDDGPTVSLDQLWARHVASARSESVSACTAGAAVVLKPGGQHDSRYRLACAVQMLCREFGGEPETSSPGAIVCRSSKGVQLKIACGVRESSQEAVTDDCAKAYERDLVAPADAGRWVIRQSPHADRHIRVNAGADMWLEIAARPRLQMPDLSRWPTDVLARCRSVDPGVIRLPEPGKAGLPDTPASVEFPVRCISVEADMTAIVEMAKQRRRAWCEAAESVERLSGGLNPYRKACRDAKDPSTGAPFVQWPIPFGTLEPWQDIVVYRPRPLPPVQPQPIGRRTMPDLVGLTAHAAVMKAESLRDGVGRGAAIRQFDACVREQFGRQTSGPETVVAQSPGVGKVLEPGDAIEMFVQRCPSAEGAGAGTSPPQDCYVDHTCESTPFEYKAAGGAAAAAVGLGGLQWLRRRRVVSVIATAGELDREPSPVRIRHGRGE